MLDFDTLVPMLPSGGLELFGATAVTCKLWHAHRVPGAGQPLRDVAHLERCSAEAMDEEEAHGAPDNAYAVVDEMHANYLLCVGELIALSEPV